MKSPITICIAFMTFSGLTLFGDELPTQDFMTASEAKTDMGTWTLIAGAERRNFPRIQEVAELELSDGSKWATPAAGTFFQVDGYSLQVRTPGLSDENSEQGKWLPLIIFTPAQPGTFDVKGTLDLWSDAASEGSEDGGEDNVRWVVAKRTTDIDFDILAEGKAHRMESVFLEEIEEAQGIELQEGEAIALAIFRNRYHHASGGTFSDIIIEKSSQ